MLLQESGEMYLESIYVLTKKSSAVRSIDVCEYMGYSKPSVRIEKKNLRENGYIEVMGDGSLSLLPPGMEIARKLYERHTMLTEFLKALGVDGETASEDACKMEHIISDESFEAMKRFKK